MENHFLKNIQIKNFKCFNDIEADGFARVNLIGGKNNVGKTAFMEALYLNAASFDVSTFSAGLYGIKAMRETQNSFLRKADQSNTVQKIRENTLLYIEQSDNIFVKSNINSIRFIIEEGDGLKKYNFEIGDTKNISINSNDFSLDLGLSTNCSFLFGSEFGNEGVSRKYSSVQKKDKEEYVDSFLNKFDSDIKAFKIINEIPQCKSLEKDIVSTFQWVF